MINQEVKHYTLILPSGEFTQIVRCSQAEAVATANARGFGETLIEGEWSGEDYYFDVSPQPRPSFSLVYQQSVMAEEVFSVTGIPIGTEVTYPGPTGEPVTETVNDEFIEWSSVEPGTYQFTFVNFPYKELTIDAVVTAN